MSVISETAFYMFALLLVTFMIVVTFFGLVRTANYFLGV